MGTEPGFDISRARFYAAEVICLILFIFYSELNNYLRTVVKLNSIQVFIIPNDIYERTRFNFYSNLGYRL